MGRVYTDCVELKELKGFKGDRSDISAHVSRLIGGIRASVIGRRRGDEYVIHYYSRSVRLKAEVHVREEDGKLVVLDAKVCVPTRVEGKINNLSEKKEILEQEGGDELEEEHALAGVDY